MAQILVDANKYLEFYQSSRMGGLINTLVAVKDALLVTRQIVDEVNRNRVSIAQQSLVTSFPQKAPRYSVP